MSDLQIIVFLFAALLVVVFAIGVAVRIAYECARRKRVLQARLRELNDVHSRLAKRAELVVQHASDYTNSIGAEGVRSLNSLRLKLESVAHCLIELDELLRRGTAAALDEIEHRLRASAEEEGVQLPFNDFRSMSDTLSGAWERDIEKLILKVGREVQKASEQRERAGLQPPSARSRRGPTKVDLLRAGIKP